MRNGLTHVFRAMDALLGRRMLWRMSRAAYSFSRRDGPNDFAINGERELQRLVAATVGDRGMVAFDVGANLGEWSQSMMAISPEVRIVAFEPVPKLAAIISEFLDDVVAKAASDRPGTTTFTVTGDLTGTNSMASMDGGKAIEVETTTVEIEAAARGIRHIDLLKIDVEGFDLAVLKGSLPLLAERRVAVAQFEYNWRWRFNHAFLADVFDLIDGLPYHLGKILPGGGIEIYDRWHPELDRFIEGNYVLVREDMMGLLHVHRGSFDPSNTYA